MNRILLAHDGDWPTLVAIPWLADRHGAEVVTVTLDLGQPANLVDVREQALAAGAVRAHVIDARERLAEHLVLPALRAGAICLDKEDPLVRPLASPLVAWHVADVAAMEQASAIAHGGTAERLPRLLTSRTATPVLPSLADAMSREDRARAAAPLGLAGAGEAEWPRGAPTLWGRPVVKSGGAGRAARSNADAAREVDPAPAAGVETAPTERAVVEITVQNGVPAAVNGVSMGFLELIGSLEVILGGTAPNAFGWHAPAAKILSRAFLALESLCLSPRLLELRRQLAQAYVDVLRDGDWFSPEREAIDAFTARSLTTVSGSLRFELANGDLLLQEARPRVVGAGEESRAEIARALTRSTT
ncbi:MAG: argininosuccinate synthase domain-containing protein [Vicinamibacteraceae bacterium]